MRDGTSSEITRERSEGGEGGGGLSRRGFVAAMAGAAGALGGWKGAMRSAHADPPETPFDYELPYTSQRMPVLAQHCVATSQPLAAQAGLEMLRRGGNAVDAAVATAAALTVVEPTSNGIGSDNFALIWMNGRLHGLNASGRAPMGLKRSDYEGLDSVPLYGWEAVTTPGAVSGWAGAIEKFGSLPFEQVLEPAIHYAREGYLVSPEVARYWGYGERRYQGDAKFDAWRKTFLIDGRPPAPGELFKSPGHADTLQRIASTKGRDFYEGDLALQIEQASRAHGGALRAADLAAHQYDWVEPISVDYRGWRLHEIPPNGQGLTALLALGMMRRFDIGDMPVDSVESIHIQIEAMKLAFADAHRYIADPEFMDVAVADLLDPAYLESRARRIERTRAQNFRHGMPRPGGTVLLTAADAEGNMVSWIQSNYTGFGSGMVVPGTGIALQNRGGNFAIEKGHPNDIAPGKRPYHTIIPGFLTRPGENGEQIPVMAFGVMGGFMQPQGHAQVVSRIVDHGQNPQAALDAPRWQVHDAKRVTIEPGLKPEVYEGLKALGHDLSVQRGRSASFGRGQIIWRLDDGYVAASDLRADGQAVGF